MLKYMLKMKDGSVGIMTLIEGTPEQAIAQMPNKGDIISFREIQEIPVDRTFRNAWCDVTKEATVDIDMKKAKEIKLNDLREKRQPRLDDLDKEMLKALENGDDVKKAEIKAAKQVLRDITNPLKNLEVDGVNNNVLLQQIIELGKIDG